MTIIGVALAGALGALARYVLGGWIAIRMTGAFPWETLVINVSGSFVLGFLFVLLTERFLPHPALRISLTVGFVGAYTTFSTFSFETFRLIEDGALTLALGNVFASVATGLLAVYLGIVVGRTVWSSKERESFCGSSSASRTLGTASRCTRRSSSVCVSTASPARP